MSQPVARITTNLDNKAAGALNFEGTKKRLVFGRLLCLHVCATYLQGSAMAAMGEWKDERWCSKVTCTSLDHAVG